MSLSGGFLGAQIYAALLESERCSGGVKEPMVGVVDFALYLLLIATLLCTIPRQQFTIFVCCTFLGKLSHIQLRWLGRSKAKQSKMFNTKRTNLILQQKLSFGVSSYSPSEYILHVG